MNLPATRPMPFPNRGTKQYRLLNALLQGRRVDPAYAVLNFNLPTLQARASELRRMGWPIRTEKEGHPRLKGETWDVYFMDEHFRGWIMDNPGRHPAEYGFSEGRGRFTRKDE